MKAEAFCYFRKMRNEGFPNKLMNDDECSLRMQCIVPAHFTDSPPVPQLLQPSQGVSMLCQSGDGFEPPCLGLEPTPLTRWTGELVFYPPAGLKLQVWCLGERTRNKLVGKSKNRGTSQANVWEELWEETWESCCFSLGSHGKPPAN